MRYYHFLNTDGQQIINFLDGISRNGIKIVDNFWQNLTVEGIGAFLGALFAFIVSMLTLWIEKTRARFIIHKNAIVTLEYILNDHLNDIATNDFLIKHNVRILNDGHLTYNRFSLLDLPQELELKLGDLTVINKYFSYRESIRRINADLNKINIGLDNINNYSIITGRIPSENFPHFIAQMGTIAKYLDKSFLKETKDLLAFSRIYLRRISSFKEKGLNIYKLNGYTPITKAEIEAELKILNKEIEETMKESRENIKEVLNNEKS